MWLFLVITAVIFFATLAMCVQQGVWNNTLTLMNMLLSGLIAYGCQGALAKLAVDNGMGNYSYMMDFVMLWALYVVAFVVLHRVLGGLTSKTRMRFKHPIDTIGGPLTAAIAGWLMAGIVGASLHAAPFDEKVFGGALVEPSRSAMTNPDVAWLNLAEGLLGEGNVGRAGSKFSQAKYITEFRKQRAALEQEKSLVVK